MLKPEQVLESVAYAAEEAWANEATWQEIVAAAINAWPGMTAKQRNEHVALFHADPALILPLTENPDAEA